LLLALLLLGLPACDSGRGNRLEGWNVLLLTLDTTRQDRIGAYGYGTARTPVLDRLAADGVRFDQAVAQAPITLPTHASILTGLNPTRHGARINGFHRLADDHVTLAEILKAAGYQTGAAVSAFVLDRRFGLAQGFDAYDDNAESMSRANEFEDASRPAAETTRAALRIAGEFAADRPFLLWVHYFDPHFPYTPPPEIGRKFPSTKSGQYDGEIAVMDREIGNLLDGLERLGRMDETLIVTVADHGEGFPGPHDEDSHGFYVYEDTLRVPLLFTARGRWSAPRTVDRLVRQIDISPTVVDLLGIEAAVPFEGTSFRPLLEGAETAGEDVVSYAEAIAPWASYGWAVLYQLRDQDWKYIDAPVPELYHLAEDPLESRNLAEVRPERVRDFLALLESMDESESSMTGTGLDADDLARLRNLGYTEAPVGLDPLPRSENRRLKNPRDWIDVHLRIQEVDSLFLSGRVDEAIEGMRTLLARDPENFEILSRLGHYLVSRGDLEEAEAAYRRITEIRPDLSMGFDRLGDVLEMRALEQLREVRRADAERLLDEAAANWRKAVELGIFDVGPRVRLGSLHLQKGRYLEAEAVLRPAVQVAPEDFDANHLLGGALLLLGRPAEAKDYLARAVELAGKKRGMRILASTKLTDAYYNLREFGRAADTLEALLRDFPDDPNAAEWRSILARLRAAADGRGSPPPPQTGGEPWDER
jgi:arylsulfatase A-like enzyme/cytochrome c-type biogenesis protein CcmH/NrfG